MKISKLTKGQVRKLNALRKSLGPNIADPAFSKWLKTQKSNKSGGKPDPVATQLERSLESLASKKINLGTWGYTIKKAKGMGKRFRRNQKQEIKLGIRFLQDPPSDLSGLSSLNR